MSASASAVCWPECHRLTLSAECKGSFQKRVVAKQPWEFQCCIFLELQPLSLTDWTPHINMPWHWLFWLDPQPAKWRERGHWKKHRLSDSTPMLTWDRSHDVKEQISKSEFFNSDNWPRMTRASGWWDDNDMCKEVQHQGDGQPPSVWYWASNGLNGCWLMS